MLPWQPAPPGGSEGTKVNYPNDLQPWKPPMLFQFCKVRVPEDLPNACRSPWSRACLLVCTLGSQARVADVDGDHLQILVFVFSYAGEP